MSQAAMKKTEWERYGRKLAEAERLLDEGERKKNEARCAASERAQELERAANKLEEDALHEAEEAQRLAMGLKKRIDRLRKLSGRGDAPRIPSAMKAAVVKRFGEPLTVVDDFPTPTPKEGEVLIEVRACGVCHTDLHALNGDWPVKPVLPLIPGHEGVGEVVALGDGVERVKVGDRVGVPWLHRACGYCEHCLAGWETLCHSQLNTGYSVHGGYAEYMVAPERYVGVLPEELSYEVAAPLLCAGLTTYKGLKETEVRPGQWCVIFGMGGLGHVGLQYARFMGLNTIAIDVQDHALHLAKQLGADMTINAAKEDPGARVWKEVKGAHGCLVTAAASTAFQQAMATVRRGGTVVLVGLPPESFPLDIFKVAINRITVRGSIVGTRLDLQECLDIAAKGKVKPRIHTRPLKEINDVIDEMKAGQIDGRVVLSPL